MLKEASKQFLQKSKAIILILVGTISWSLVMVRNGLCWDKGCAGGLGFWGANGHDGIWHIALIRSLSEGSFQSPIFSGWNIQNYHVGFDLILAFLHKITSVPALNIYFQIIPPILAFLIGYLTYKFVILWTKSGKSAFWSTFFVYFGGSLGWVVSILRKQGWGGESMFWSMQSVSTLINPPFALSLILLLTGLILLLKLRDKFNVRTFIFCVLCFGVLIETKVYAGLLILGGLLLAGMYSLVIKHQSSIIKVFLAALVIALVVYLPFNKLSASLISWYPFWFLESMIAAGDRLYIPKLAEAMLSYKNQQVIGKFALAYGAAFALFIVGNFGTRIVFLFRKIKFKDEVEILIYSIIGAGILIPTFFVQEGTPWNTIQFLYYSLFFASILSGTVIGNLSNLSNASNASNVSKIPNLSTSIIRMIEVIIILLTIPTTIFTLKDVYLPPKPPAILPANEAEGLKFLSGEPYGVVLTYPYNEDLAKKAVAPRPLYLYTSTAYVSAFSGQPVFLEDQINLDIMQYPWQERLTDSESFLNTLDVEIAGRFLKENNITYIYWLKGKQARIGDKQLGLTEIFKNDEVVIFKVN